MKKISLLSFLFSAVSIMETSAHPVVTSAPCPCPQPFQGVFIGGNVGYGFGGAKVSQVTHFPGANSPTAFTSGSTRIHGVDGGLNVGYNKRFCNFGLGLEGVFNWTNSKGRGTLGIAFPNGTMNTIRGRAKLDNSIQLRANFSYIYNLIAPKIILGWDTSQWTQTFTAVDVLNDTFRAKRKKRYNGFLVGAGVDFLLTQYLIAGAEYTCIVSEKKSFEANTAGVTQKFTFHPQYNKFALVVKFIY